MTKVGNFEISVELKELKIHVKGHRELAPDLASNVAHQIAGIIQPAALLEGASEPQNNGHSTIEIPPPTRRTRKRPAGRVTTAPANGGAKPINWNHDPERWGTPLQTWKQSQKINWLLHVAEQSGVRDRLSPTEMSDVFAAKFKSAGPLLRQNIARDLGKATDLFGEMDGLWFLKQAGKEAAIKLVEEAKGNKVAA